MQGKLLRQVLDKLMKSLIISKIDFNQLLIGDKNAIMVAARILGYGAKYKFTYNEEEHEVDLSLLENNDLNVKVSKNGKDLVSKNNNLNIFNRKLKEIIDS